MLTTIQCQIECIQEATSEFISFITSEAADRATSEKRKTITGDDILNALKTLGFDEMSEVLLIYLAKYREVRLYALLLLFGIVSLDVSTIQNVTDNNLCFCAPLSTTAAKQRTC